MDYATKATRSASDILLTEPWFALIVSVVLRSRAIFQRRKHIYKIYVVSITIRIVRGFMLITLIWQFDFSSFMILIITIHNDITIMMISTYRVKPSLFPASWRMSEIFTTGVVLGRYLAVCNRLVLLACCWNRLLPDKLYSLEYLIFLYLHSKIEIMTIPIYL